MTTETLELLPMERAVLDITGMTCAACVRRVERALTKVDGVSAAAVNLLTEQAQATFDPSRTDREKLESAVLAAGYGILPQAPATASDAADQGRAEHERRERSGLLRDLALAAAATVPLLVLGMSHGAIPFAESTAGRLTQFALASLVLFGPGMRLLRGGLAALRHRSPDMNTLVSLGALAAWLWSTVATFAPGWFAHGEHEAPHVYFEAAGAILSFVLLGKFLESRARWRLGDAVRTLHALVPSIAHRVDGEDTSREVDVPVATLQPGDRVRVRPGERVPVDRGEGERVVGGSTNSTGALVVRVERTGSDTAIARIAAAVEEAQGSRAPIARFADRASAAMSMSSVSVLLSSLWLRRFGRGSADARAWTAPSAAAESAPCAPRGMAVRRPRAGAAADGERPVAEGFRTPAWEASSAGARCTLRAGTIHRSPPAPRASRSTPIARNSTPQTFEKRRRERDKQEKQQAKATARRERNAHKKAIRDGEIPPEAPLTIDPATMQPDAYEKP